MKKKKELLQDAKVLFYKLLSQSAFSGLFSGVVLRKIRLKATVETKATKTEDLSSQSFGITAWVKTVGALNDDTKVAQRSQA